MCFARTPERHYSCICRPFPLLRACETRVPHVEHHRKVRRFVRVACRPPLPIPIRFAWSMILLSAIMFRRLDACHFHLSRTLLLYQHLQPNTFYQFNFLIFYFIKHSVLYSAVIRFDRYKTDAWIRVPHRFGSQSWRLLSGYYLFASIVRRVAIVEDFWSV